MLIVIGCSWSYGNEISEHDCFNYAWPVHLGKHLNKEVVNLAQPGGSNENSLINFMTFIAYNELHTDTLAIFQTTEFTRKAGFKKSSIENPFRGKLIKPSKWVDRFNGWLSIHKGADEQKEFKNSWKTYATIQMCPEELVHRNLIQIYKFQMMCKALNIKHLTKPAWIHPAHKVQHIIKRHKLLDITNGIDWSLVSNKLMIEHIFDKYNFNPNIEWSNLDGPKPKKYKPFIGDELFHEYHPNKDGHKLIADCIYEELNLCGM